jgi:hypothetical protein
MSVRRARAAFRSLLLLEQDHTSANYDILPVFIGESGVGAGILRHPGRTLPGETGKETGTGCCPVPRQPRVILSQTRCPHFTARIGDSILHRIFDGNAVEGYRDKPGFRFLLARLPQTSGDRPDLSSSIGRRRGQSTRKYCDVCLPLHTASRAWEERATFRVNPCPDTGPPTNSAMLNFRFF